MKSVKIFFTTLLSSVCIVLLSFAALYWAIAPSHTQVGTSKTDVPLLTAESGDIKTALVATEIQHTRFFFVIKLNAVKTKISIAAIPADYHLAKAGRTLSQSLNYAGIMQCVQDLTDDSGIPIDYHLLLDEDSLKQLLSAFGDTNMQSFAHIIPQDIASFWSDTAIDANALADLLCRCAPQLDTAEGLEFLTHLTAHLIQNNTVNIQNYTLADITDSFSVLSTNIGVQQAARLNRIFTLLRRSEPQFETAAITDSDTAKEI
ncbi:MAG: hypothetical protein IJW74_02920, partial [Oscillospiraceae bacterium]|nr:hypothetical protein [Oscillospiraceae bacterium]